jgi:hypothetical protein
MLVQRFLEEAGLVTPKAKLPTLERFEVRAQIAFLLVSPLHDPLVSCSAELPNWHLSASRQ